MRIEIITHVIVTLTILKITYSENSDNVARASKQTPLLSAAIAPESQPMVSAVLLECPKELKESLNSERVEKHPRNDKQLMVNIRVNPSFHIEKVEKFLILDELYDPHKRSKAKIMSPYLIEISRGEPVMMYPLEFSKSIKLGEEKPTTNENSEQNTAAKDNKLEDNAQTVSLNRVISKIATSITPVTKISSVESKENQDSNNKPLKAQGTKQKNLVNENKNKAESGTLRRQAIHSSAVKKSVTTKDNHNRELNIGYLTSGSKYQNDLSGQNNAGSDINLPSMVNVGVERHLIKQLSDSILKKSGDGSGNDNEINASKEKHLSEQSGSKHRKDTLQRDHTIYRKEVQSKSDEKHDNSNSVSEDEEKDSRIETSIHEDGDEFGDEIKPYGHLQNAAIAGKRPFILKRRIGRKQFGRPRIFRKYPSSFEILRDQIDYEVPEQHFTGSSVDSEEYMKDYFRPCNCDKSIHGPPMEAKASKLKGDLETNRYNTVHDGRPQNIHSNNGFLKTRSQQQFNDYDDYETRRNLGPERKMQGLNRNEYHYLRDDQQKGARLLRNASSFNPDLNGVAVYNLNGQNELPSSSRRADSFITNNCFDYEDDGKRHKIPRSSEKDYNTNLGSLSYLRINKGFRKPPFSRKMHAKSKLPSNLYENLEMVYKPNRYQINHAKEMGDSDYDDNKYEDIPEYNRVTYVVPPNREKYKANTYVYYARPSNKHVFRNKQDDDDQFSDYRSSERVYPFSDVRFSPRLHFGNKNMNRKNKENDMSYPYSLWDEPSIPYLATYAKPEKTGKNIEPSFADYGDTYPFKPPQNSRGSAEHILSQEPEKYLPKKLPYEKLLDDPHLSLNDKLNMIDTMDPYNYATDQKLKQLTREMEKSVFVKPYDLPVPLPLGILNTRKALDNSKKKRSFVFYDDLTMRDTSLDNDYNFDDIEHKGGKPSSQTRHVEEDIRPCSSCGGKNKKPPTKADSQILSRDNYCECRNQQASCTCTSQKMPRSVSDTWYSVFNMSAPLPFLTTKMRIFRKRRNIWLKIAPSITLSSLSGIFANANLSILFSSHVDIFQLEKSLRLQNHQLLIPKDDTPVSRRKTFDPEDKFTNFNYFNLNPNRVLALDNNAYYFDELERNSSNTEHAIVNRKDDIVKKSNLKKINQINDGSDTFKRAKRNQRDLRKFRKNNIQTVADLGYFPVSMNFLEQCPNDKHRLCLNMLDDKVPAYSIKLKMPFRENAVIHRNIHKVKITRLIADATTKDVMQVSIDLINEGLEMQKFLIFVSNCDMPCGAAKSKVEKTLLPHIGETVTFLLPLISDSSQKHKRFKCDVVVKTITSNISETATVAKSKTAMKKVQRSADRDRTKRKTMKTIAMRQLVVETDNRCFCVWECNCHCISKLETHVDFNVCQKLTYNEEKAAGLLMHCQDGVTDDAETCFGDDEIKSREINEDNYIYVFFKYALLLLGIMLLLGLLKAIIGRFFCARIDRCGFDYAQPGKGYDDSSRSRRYFVNVVFFIVFPFFIWCKCFTPSQEDLLVASTEWQCAVGQSTPATSEKDYKKSKSKAVDNNISEEENVILSQHIERKSRKKDRMGGGEDIFDIENELNNISLEYDADIFEDDEDDEDEEANTKYILQALVNSRESLRKLLQTSQPQDLNMTTEEFEKLQEAADFVQLLKSAQIVYRTLDCPIGNVRNIPYGVRYCIQGYFLPCAGAEYEFITYHPLVQYHCFSYNGKCIEALRPPILLCSKEFSRTYANQLEVLRANDLSVHPPSFVPCINVSSLISATSSLIKLTSERSICGLSPKINLDPLLYSPTDQRSLLPYNCEERSILPEPSSQPLTYIAQDNNDKESQVALSGTSQISEDGSDTKCQKYTYETIYE